MNETKQRQSDGARVGAPQLRWSAGAPDPLRDSPRMVAQRARIEAAFGEVAQTASLRDGQPLQARMEAPTPHEAWHVVQQAQGRAQPTMQMAGAAVSNGAVLEREADAMGLRVASWEAQAAMASVSPSDTHPLPMGALHGAVAQREKLASGKLNVAGEHHSEVGQTNGRQNEKTYVRAMGFNGYFEEQEYRHSSDSSTGAAATVFSDPVHLRIAMNLAVIHDTKAKNEGLPQEDARGDGAWDELLAVIKKRFVQIGEEFKRIDEEDAAAVAMREEIRPLMLGFLQKVRDGQHVQEKMLATDSFLEAAKRIVSEQIGKPWATVREFGARRSDAMHVNANQAAADNSVWKVGNAHVTDMLVLGPKNYNLVTREEFNEGFNAWRTTRGSVASADAGADAATSRADARHEGKG
ncbi:hypothetical protein [Pseudorhodoferax soli]|uniref:DUF4157 domain-containing protein n=1 Tax=Pseudorhodoferax soli TaxID=545864 RepID=A0A368YE34_9BURK|nr:hypothetical protein [Pseudorhodoferax soli]RCW76444.1 hypothetical protein DES41_1011050 [Pseudorhodoferax soli]